MQERLTPIEARSPVKIMLKIEHPVTCLATMAYVNAACAVHVTIFSTVQSSRFQILRSYTLIL